jgi:hypothetical protein
VHVQQAVESSTTVYRQCIDVIYMLLVIIEMVTVCCIHTCSTMHATLMCFVCKTNGFLCKSSLLAVCVRMFDQTKDD